MTIAIQKPKKFRFVQVVRKYYDAAVGSIPWPNIHPDIISALEFVAAIIFLLAMLNRSNTNIWIACVALLLGNLLDSADGAIARKYNYHTPYGWLVDIITDRITELLTFIVFPWPWLLIWTANLIYSVVGYKYGYHAMFALRIPFLIYFIYVFIVPLIF